jgi:hypothetical protein
MVDPPDNTATDPPAISICLYRLPILSIFTEPLIPFAMIETLPDETIMPLVPVRETEPEWRDVPVDKVMFPARVLPRPLKSIKCPPNVSNLVCP